MSTVQSLFNVIAIQAMAQVLVPAARAQAGEGCIEILAGDSYIGHITVSNNDEWYATSVQCEMDSRRKSPVSFEEVAGPFSTPSEAVRALFGGPLAPKVQIENGVSGDDQQSSFENATLQVEGDIAYSIATFLTVPVHVVEDGAQRTEQYLSEMLGRASLVVPGLKFNVQIGPNETSD